MGKKYIHYGSSQFIPEAFREIRNETFTKPIGGLWASAKDAVFGWKAFCEQENFCLSALKYSFEFELIPEARILKIKYEDINNLPMNKEKSGYEGFSVFLDFEKIKEEYDVIDLSVTEDPSFYWLLWGWDCDCILVLNKDVIVA